MYFSVKYDKTQGVSKKPLKTQDPQKKNQEPKIGSKNPRSWEKTQGVATLLRVRIGHPYWGAEAKKMMWTN